MLFFGKIYKAKETFILQLNLLPNRKIKPSIERGEFEGFIIFKLKKYGGFMKSLKKLSLILTTFAFCLSLLAATAIAQPGKAKYRGNKGNHYGWEKGKHKGWNKGKKTGWMNRDDRWDRYDDRYERRTDRNYRRGRISEEEYRRLERRRSRIERLRDRYDDDGVINNREQRRLSNRYGNYTDLLRRVIRN
jgi:hypothetical protein